MESFRNLTLNKIPISAWRGFTIFEILSLNEILCTCICFWLHCCYL